MGMYGNMRRTDAQNRSLYRGFELLAEALNNAGLDKQAVFRIKKVSVPWTKTGVKEDLYAPIMEAMYGKGSTTELERVEVSKVWDVLMRALGENLAFPYIPFPSEDEQG